MRLQDLNWKGVERYLQNDNRIIIPIGATEQHAYLSLNTDTLIASRIALAAVEREPTLIAPCINFGVSADFADFPGTISLSRATFEAMLSEIVESLYHQGFTRIFIINGHSGSQLPTRLNDLSVDGAIKLIWYDWWRESAARQFEVEYGLKITHANWSENFPFNRVGDSPTDTKPVINLDLLEESSPREVIGDGSYGGAYQIEDERMAELFGSVVDEVTELLRELKN